MEESKDDNNFGVTGNGYIKESDYVKLLDNHGFKVMILILQLFFAIYITRDTITHNNSKSA